MRPCLSQGNDQEKTSVPGLTKRWSEGKGQEGEGGNKKSPGKGPVGNPLQKESIEARGKGLSNRRCFTRMRKTAIKSARQGGDNPKPRARESLPETRLGFSGSFQGGVSGPQDPYPSRKTRKSPTKNTGRGEKRKSGQAPEKGSKLRGEEKKKSTTKKTPPDARQTEAGWWCFVTARKTVPEGGGPTWGGSIKAPEWGGGGGWGRKRKPPKKRVSMPGRNRAH